MQNHRGPNRDHWEIKSCKFGVYFGKTAYGRCENLDQSGVSNKCFVCASPAVVEFKTGYLSCVPFAVLSPLLLKVIRGIHLLT